MHISFAFWYQDCINTQKNAWQLKKKAVVLPCKPVINSLTTSNVWPSATKKAI